MKIKTLRDLFVHTLKDIHYAEKRIYKALPMMADASDDEDLKQALSEHRLETEGQIERLKEVFAILEMKPGSEECDAINGIIDEADGILDDTDGTDMRDNAVIASAQAVEHYEIVRYRSLVMWAGALGLEEAVELLQKSLEEEQRADEKLMKFAAYCQNVTDVGDEDKPSKSAPSKSQSSKTSALAK